VYGFDNVRASVNRLEFLGSRSISKAKNVIVNLEVMRMSMSIGVDKSLIDFLLACLMDGEKVCNYG